MSDSKSTTQLKKLQDALLQKEQEISSGFDQIATLTKQLEMNQGELVALKQQIEHLKMQIDASATQTESTKDQLSASAVQDKNARQINLVANSELFDAEWYLETYPDVAKSEKFSLDPAAHYTLFGAFEGRKPCPEFDSAFYIKSYEDVAKAGINPLVHYLNFGRAEGRAISASIQDN